MAVFNYLKPLHRGVLSVQLSSFQLSDKYFCCDFSCEKVEICLRRVTSQSLFTSNRTASEAFLLPDRAHKQSQGGER